MANYKLHLPKYTIYESKSEKTKRTTWKDYWTTVTADEDSTNEELIEMAKKNLKVQIAQNELFNVKLWQSIFFDFGEIEIIRA